MRSIFAFLLLTLSLNSFAMDWFDMESGVTYKLTQPLSLPMKKINRGILELPAGEPFVLKYVTGGAGLGILTFHYPNCPGSQMETEVEVIPVKNSPIEIGAMVAEGCELWVFVELKDYFTPAIFK
jgi:hypothetical protein